MALAAAMISQRINGPLMQLLIQARAILHPAVRSWPAKIGDVGHPDLLRRHRRGLARSCLEQIGMAVETGWSCDMPAWAAPAAVLGQYLKQPVPPDLEPAIILTLQQIMQLAGTHPWLSQPNPAHEAHHLQSLCVALVGNPIVFVVSLTAYPPETGKP